MTDGKLLIEELLSYAKSHLDLDSRDVVYYRNLLLSELKLDAPYKGELDTSYVLSYDVPDLLREKLQAFATENKICKKGNENLFSTKIFGLLTPSPSFVNKKFNDLMGDNGVDQATKYLYNLSVKNDYVQKTAIGKNLKWEYVDGTKSLELTVNLSKPEKDNKEIAKVLTETEGEKYPECLLCKENEGYFGRETHPARQNLRTISVLLGGEPWFIQYSPYAYFNEHLIAISEKHSPMKVDKTTIDKLLDFVDYFPNYIIGSNAALPIVGGSILNHEHFQGGGHVMPMHKAPIKYFYKSKKYKAVKIGVVDWYNTVIRLESNKREMIAKVSTKIINNWERYSNEKLDIVSETYGLKHNTVAPIARKVGKTYIIDLILRNNITTKKYPDGLFHAHPEYHNIKKEGIGLIEAMGLFILPGRLKRQITEMAEVLCGLKKFEDYGEDLAVHEKMLKKLSKNKPVSVSEGEKIIKDEINDVCKNILINTAVFKNDEDGLVGLNEFLSLCGIERKKRK